jgi:uncharacterized membrane protein YhaH (DUF805 family)
MGKGIAIDDEEGRGRTLRHANCHGMSLLLECIRSLPRGKEQMSTLPIDPLIAAGVVLATALTDAAYVMFTSAVIARKRIPAASWSSIWYLLSSFAVISYTNNWVYVCFAALGSWIGAFGSMTFLHRPIREAPIGSAPE